MTSPVYIAIDTPGIEQARKLADTVRDHVGGIKLGLEFFCANGRQGVMEIADTTGLPVFLDLKLHDIPNTVAKAIEALLPLEPAIVTVHAAGGQAMLKAAKAAASPNTKVVAVTVLTSLDGADLEDIGVSGGPVKQVERLALLARDCGLDGIVCSGAEVSLAKKIWPEGFFVVPGVRPAGGGSADQKRTVTPCEAMNAGASVIVIGRPITQAPQPEEAASAIHQTLRHQMV